MNVKQYKAMKKNPKAIGRTPKGIKNKLETRFVNEILAGKTYYYESMRFKVGGGGTGFAEAWYTPDVMYVADDNRIHVVEIKGHRERASMVRFKAAALLYPFFVWQLAQIVDKEWVITKF